MTFAALLLSAALAGPAVAPAAPAPAEQRVTVQVPGAAGLIPSQPRSSRARAPVAPPLRRLLRKRDLIAPVRIDGGRVQDDPSLALLSRDHQRTSSSLLGRARAAADGPAAPLRMLLAGLRSHSLRTPPPTLAG